MTNPIYALSIRQPWAWLIIHGGKNIENRTWGSMKRGRVYVHASKGMTKFEYYDAMDFQNRFTPTPVILPEFKLLERGGIIGSVEIVDCVTDHASPWFTGPFGFVLKNPIALPFKECKGTLGFFKQPYD